MSTFLDFAIGLSLVNGISGQISRIISDFKNLDGVTDETMKKLSQFKDISITGGLLAGAGVAGLKLTKDALDSCIDEAEKLQSVSTTLEIKAFGNDLLNESKLPQIKAQMEELEDTAMDVSLGTVFNQQQIEESMIAMIKGGMSKELVAGAGAESNAYFAQINEVDAKSTAQGTVKFAAGFQLEEDQIKDSLDLITRYADASIADALAIQQNIGNVAGSAMAVWKDRDNMQVAEETIQLVTATKYLSGDEASAATMTRNFLDEAGKTFSTMTETQVKAMMNAGWLKNATINSKGKVEDAKSIFIDYDTGMLKSAEELERILEETSSKMDAVDFNNLLDTVFGDRGKKTAQALAQKDSSTDLSTLKTNAGNQLGIDEQVARQMETAVAQVGIFEESINTLKATLGKPFLEGKTAMFKMFNSVLGKAISYFKEHPQVTKYIATIASGVSAFLLITGAIMAVIGAVGALKTAFSSVGLQLIKVFLPAAPVLLAVIAIVAVLAGLVFVVYKNWNTLKPLFQNLMEHFSGLLSSLKSAFKSVGNSIMPAIKEVLKALEQGAIWFISFIIPLISDGIDMIAEIITYLTPFISKFAEMIAGFVVASIPIIKKALFSIGKIINDLRPMIQEIIATIIRIVISLIPVIQKIVSTIGKVIKAMMPVIKEIILAIGKVIKALIPIVKEIILAIGKVIKALIPIIKEIISAIGKVIKAVMPIIKEIVLAIGKVIKALIPIVKEIISAIGKIIKAMMPIVKEIISAIKKIIGAFIPIIKTIISVVRKVVSALMPIIKKMINNNIKIINALIPIIKKVISVISKIVSAVTPIIKKIIETITNIIISLIPIMQKIISIIGKVINAVTPIIKKVVETNIKVIANLISIIKKIFSVIGKIINTIISIIQKIVSVISKVMSIVLPVIEDVFKTCIEYFKDFTNGISDTWDNLKGFLGFKKEAKEELETPININVNENGKKEKVSIIPDIFQKSEDELLKQITDGKGNLNLPVNVKFNVDSPEEIEKITNEHNIGNDINLDIDFNIADGSAEKYKEIVEESLQETTITPAMDLTEIDKQMNELVADMNIVGSDGTGELANGLSGTDSLQNLSVSVDTINTTITGNLVKNEQIKTYGSNLIQSFINGINSKAADLRIAVEGVTNIMGDYLAVHSPTRKGVLHTNHLWGGNLIQSFIKGIKSKNSQLESNIVNISKTIGSINSDFNDISKNLSLELNVSKENIPKNLTSELNIPEKNIPKINPIEVQEPKMDFSSMLKNITTKGIDDINLKLKNISKDILVKLNISKEDIPKSLPIKVQPFQVDISSIANNIKSINKDNYNNNLKMPYISNENITNNHEENAAPIYIIINGGDKKENEIAEIVIKELEKRGFGKKKKTHIDSSLVNSHLRLNGGY